MSKYVTVVSQSFWYGMFFLSLCSDKASPVIYNEVTHRCVYTFLHS